MLGYSRQPPAETSSRRIRFCGEYREIVRQVPKRLPSDLELHPRYSLELRHPSLWPKSVSAQIASDVLSLIRVKRSGSKVRQSARNADNLSLKSPSQKKAASSGY